MILSLLGLAGCKPAEESDMKAIVGAVLIDGAGGPPISDSVVVVAGSRIRAAGPRASVPIPAASEKVNGSGKFLLPGLIDLHVHPGTRGAEMNPADYSRDRIEKNLNAYLYFGVTSVRSVGTDRDAAFEVRKAERGGAGDGVPLLTTRLFSSGRGFTAPGGHPSQEIGDVARQPATPEDARRQVSELAAQNADAIKIWCDGGGGRPKIKPEIMEAILDEARKHSIPVTVHIVTEDDVRFLVANGAAGFLHMIRDTEQLDPQLLKQLRSLQTVFAPTLVRQELAWLYKDHPEMVNDPDVARTVDADVIAKVREWAAKLQPRASNPGKEGFERAMRNTKRMADAGVPIGVGSDGGSANDFPGLMTHREMELLIEAGLTPMEVVQAATRNGALALKKLEELGTIAPGRRADLLLVSANPLEDIRNLRKIDRVMLNGQWIDRAGLKTH